MTSNASICAAACDNIISVTYHSSRHRCVRGTYIIDIRRVRTDCVTARTENSKRPDVRPSVRPSVTELLAANAKDHSPSSCLSTHPCLSCASYINKFMSVWLYDILLTAICNFLSRSLCSLQYRVTQQKVKHTLCTSKYLPSRGFICEYAQVKVSWKQRLRASCS